MPTKKAVKKPKKTPAKKPVKKATKKAVKKTPAKKKAAKKTLVKKITRKVPKKVFGKRSAKKQKPAFIIASDETSFWINNGPVLNSLPTLKEAFAVITVEQFKFHAGGSQNDFAIWVETILLDKKCAQELKKAKTQKTAAKKVGEALKKYKK